MPALVGEEGMGDATDTAIAQHAARHHFIIITLDLDFGEMYYFTSGRKVGVIILKLRNQTVESVNERLYTLHHVKILPRRSLRHALVIMNEQQIRIRK